MDFDINETTEDTTKDAKIAVNNASHILQSYAYVFVGMMISLVSAPVFPLVMMRKALRDPYAVLVVTFLNSEFSGISAILLGVKRAIVSAGGERFINHHECVLNVPIFLLTAFLLNGMSLLMNSVERIIVVTFPLYYYVHSRRISFSLIAAQYLITFIAVASATIASLIGPTRRISNFCWLQFVFTPPFFEASLLLTATASLLSVIFTVIAVYILRKRFGTQFLSKQFLSNHSRNNNLTQFLQNQKRYTQTSLISCCFTFLFVVLPSIAERICATKTSAISVFIRMICVHLRLLNSCNMVIVFLYRQRDLRNVTIRWFKDQFCGRKDHVQSIRIYPNN
uniref:G-protein coupled receptors family 1 profile domain-containing protein n=1 Tax=Onchocerca volvulus TaxID=6282 RepID=A0A8R1TMU5_ONCVO